MRAVRITEDEGAAGDEPGSVSYFSSALEPTE